MLLMDQTRVESIRKFISGFNVRKILKVLHKISLEADKELFSWRAFKYSNV